MDAAGFGITMRPAALSFANFQRAEMLSVRHGERDGFVYKVANVGEFAGLCVQDDKAVTDGGTVLHPHAPIVSLPGFFSAGFNATAI
jgi:hypothetical protein